MESNLTIKRIEVGPLMSQVVVGGGVVYLAGQVALSEGEKTVAEQTREILGRIDNLLAAAGSNKSRLLSASIWLTDISTFGEMNEVWKAWVDPENTPARATVEAKLAQPRFTVEIAVTALA